MKTNNLTALNKVLSIQHNGTLNFIKPFAVVYLKTIISLRDRSIDLYTQLYEKKGTIIFVIPKIIWKGKKKCSKKETIFCLKTLAQWLLLIFYIMFIKRVEQRRKKRNLQSEKF